MLGKSLITGAAAWVIKSLEGQPRPGPWLTSQGWLPASWGQYMNFWQMGYDPIGFGTNSVVEACVWAYIRAIAQLPGYHKRDQENGGQVVIKTSALSRLLRHPNFYETSSDYLVHLVRSLLYAGNSYWVAERNDRNEVVGLHWTDPRQCAPLEIAVEGQVFKEVFYRIAENPLVNFDFDRDVLIPARDVLHIKLATPRHPLKGETWLSALAIELANRSAISASASSFFGNMSRPSGVLTTDLVLNTQQVTELRERWNQQAVGLNAGGVPILTAGLKFQPVSLSASDAQVVEQLKLNDRAIAAVFGVPAMLVGIAEGGTAVKTAEAIMQEWLASGLGFLLNHIELAVDHFIGLPANEYTEYDTRALLRSMFKDRIEGLTRGVQGGIYAPNEARALEGYPAAEAGDEPRVQQQVVPLSFAGKIPPAPAPPSAPSPDDTGDGDGTGDQGDGSGDGASGDGAAKHYFRVMWDETERAVA